MAELDLDALKEAATRMACPAWPECRDEDEEGQCLACAQAAAIIAALEDGKRLRMRVQRLHAGLTKCRDTLRTCAEGHRAIDWFDALEERDD